MKALKLFARLACAALLCAAGPAVAQSTAQYVVPGYLTTVGCPTGQTTCFVAYGSGGASGGQPITYAALTPLGPPQVISLTSTATALTIPTGATTIDIFPEGVGGTNNECLRYRDDGTAPTQSTGAGLAPQQLYLGYKVNPLTNIQFILATGATCTVTINFYK